MFQMLLELLLWNIKLDPISYHTLLKLRRKWPPAPEHPKMQFVLVQHERLNGGEFSIRRLWFAPEYGDNFQHNYDRHKQQPADNPQYLQDQVQNLLLPCFPIFYNIYTRNVDHFQIDDWVSGFKLKAVITVTV